MKKLIRQILKEEVEKVSISKILTKLKKIYPKLDYCISEDGNRIKIWTFYMSSFEDMGADPEHPEEFTESGVWMELNDNSGGMDVGTFNDFRNNDGTYYDSDIDRLIVNISLSSSPQSILTTLIGVLDDELSVESGITGAATKNYEGRPDGESGFDWRKC